MNDNLNSQAHKAPLPNPAAKTPQEWRAYCAELLAEIDKLRKQNIELREQKRVYASMIPIPEDVKKLADMPLDELLAMCVGQQTIDQIIHELEHEAGK
jgi:hypothetical protein